MIDAIRHLIYTHRYKRLGPGTRWEAGIIVRGEDKVTGIKTLDDDTWVLHDGRRITTKDIHTLDIARHLAGYD